MRGGFDYDRAALILAEAAYRGDQETARRREISERTIYNYRKRMERDEKLSELFKTKRAAFEKDWADDLPASIRASIDFLRQAALAADKKDPEVIHAIAGALKIQTEVAVVKDVLDARLARERGQANPPDRSVAAAGDGSNERPTLDTAGRPTEPGL